MWLLGGERLFGLWSEFLCGFVGAAEPLGKAVVLGGFVGSGEAL